MKIAYDVVGVGNAIVDILAYTDTEFLHKENLPLGAMTLVDRERSKSLYANMSTATECSGGSAANTLAGLASLGAKVAFIGKVANDGFGKIFRHDMENIGVDFDTEAETRNLHTASCLVFVTPGGQGQSPERTMATYLGACKHITKYDIDPEVIRASKVTYLEGYLWDEPEAKEAIRRAIELAKEAKRKVSFTLSDVFCVDRHRAEFMELAKNGVDILFSNEREMASLLQSDDLEANIKKVQGMCEIVVITRSAKGCVVITKDEILRAQAEPVNEVFDVTGAGDLFASGFLYGYVNDLSLAHCAKLASLCAGEVIQYLGGRPPGELRPLLKKLPE